MILSPSGGTGALDSVNNRTVTVINYKWGSNGPSQTDFNDTLQAIIKAGDNAPVRQCIISISSSNVGFNISYVLWSQATLSERAAQSFNSIKVSITDLFTNIYTAGQNFATSFSFSVLWSDFQKIFSEFGMYIIIFLVLILVLFFWSKK